MTDLLSMYAGGAGPEALQMLTDQCFPTIRKIVDRRVRQLGAPGLREMKDDIAHNALLRTHQSLCRTSDPSKIGNLNGWIWTNCVREVIDTFRSQQRTASRTVAFEEHRDGGSPGLSTYPSEQHLFESVSQNERVRHVKTCMASLTRRAREALNLRLTGSEVLEIAELLGLKPMGTHTLLRRARVSVMTCLEQRGWDVIRS